MGNGWLGRKLDGTAVVLDLRYEARDIDQTLTNRDKIDQWFEAKTKGLNDLAKAQLKQKWGTMQRVLSSQERLEKIVADILLDMSTKPRLMDGHGNAMLVAGRLVQLSSGLSTQLRPSQYSVTAARFSAAPALPKASP